jgi:integrase
MTGSLHKKEGRKNWFAVLNTCDSNGKRKQKWVDTGVSTKGDNKRKAEAKLQELLVQYGNGRINPIKDPFFTDFMEQWLDLYKPSLSPTTYDAYRMTLDVHILPFFKPMKLRVKEITPVVVQEYICEKLKVMKSNTVRKHLANISKCLESAERQRIIPYNPVKCIDLPKKVKFTGAKHYDEKEILRLLECAKGDPLEIVIKLTLFYGLRRSEILGLRWSSIDFKANTLTINHTVVKVGHTVHRHDRTKNESSCTTFPVSEKIISALVEWRIRQQELKALQPNDYHDSDYICTYADGRPLSPHFVSSHFKILLKNSGMPHIRFHDLRHSAACYLKYMGFDLKDIQVWLRHKDIQTTMNIYVSLGMEEKTNIANRLDAKFQSLAAW